jgi:hypothetical protein
MKRGTTPVLITSSIGGLRSTNISQHIGKSKLHDFDTEANNHDFDTEENNQWNNWPSGFVQKIP